MCVGDGWCRMSEPEKGEDIVSVWHGWSGWSQCRVLESRVSRASTEASSIESILMWG